MPANVVNLDALIRREDLAAPSEAAADITSLPIMGLEPKGLLYPALCKPDFQRETVNWTPEQVSDLICTFLRRDLIPAIILWRAGQNVFVIDGAHRLSALIAWVLTTTVTASVRGNSFTTRSRLSSKGQPTRPDRLSSP